MKKLLAILILILISSRFAFTVSTKYLTDYKFDNIELYEFSNISFVENGGIELAHDYKVLFTGKNPVWSLSEWKGGLLAGTGDPAQLLYLKSGGYKNILEFSNQVLVSDIKQFNGALYISSFPKGAITILDENFKESKRIPLKNEYIWNIVPDMKGYFVLTGSPASICHFNDRDELEYSIPVPGEENLLKGLADGDDLYFSADGNILYKFNSHDKKVRAVYSFDNSIMDIIYVKNLMYIITSASEYKNLSHEVLGESSSDTNEKKTSRTGTFKSDLYSYDMKLSVEKIFEKANIRFISLSYWNDSIVIGTDKNAGYYQISLKGNERKFSGLGAGKFARLLELREDNFALLLDPTRIIRLEKEFAGKGFMVSGSFDTGNISRWGKLSIDSSIFPGTSLTIYTRSGAIPEDNLWEEWLEYKNRTASSPNRYFQYMAELGSGGGNTPVFNGITVPFIQKNSAPRIDKISLNYNNNIYKLSWDGEDEDRDILIYNLYLALSNESWVKINDKPLEENNFEINPANYPEGQYRIKVTVSDERSNSPAEAKEGFKISEPFMIVNSSPVIGDIALKKNGKTAMLAWKVTDNLSPVLEVDYMVNGLKWLKVLPEDVIYDSKTLMFDLKLNIDEPSFIVIKASDLYGNYSTKGIFVEE